MPDHSDNGLRASIQALSDVVAPALDPTDEVAAQQLRFVIAFLEFHRERLGLALDRDRFELRHDLALAERVIGHAQGAGLDTDALRAALDGARDVDARFGIRPGEVRESRAALESALTGAVREAEHSDDPAARELEREVVRGARAELEAQRAWFLPHGFEVDPDSLPPLPVALGIDAERETSR